MTDQTPETLIYEGEMCDMCTEPLNAYLNTTGEMPDFEWQHTGCRRGYEGTWEISDGKLYLIQLSGITKAGETVNLETLFPGFPERVFADWYTGTARLPQGEMLEYIQGSYASIFERDLFIEFDNGVVTHTYTRENVASPKKASWGILSKLRYAFNSGY
ncbi:MAG: hypothetical protein KBA57_01720 [Sphingomonadaceae bacterium]|nr:hypothetical protein [Sphingomonadaceae bacterium]